MAWKFRIKDHRSDAKWELSLEQASVNIGRDPNNDVVLTHDRVSRRHLELRKADSGRIKVSDLSINGSFVHSGNEWVRVDANSELPLPCVLRVAYWTIKIDHVATPKSVAEQVEQTWDDSVMIPAANLGQHTEAILVFDLCESSLIASKDDHMAHHLKRRLSQIADPVLKQHGRRFFKSTGDGFLATFDSPEESLRAAVKVEDHLQYRNLKTTNLPIHYRIALHYGEVWEISAGDDGDVHGHDVNVTFRIEGVQTPAFPQTKVLFPKRDRILCSKDYRDVVAEHLDEVTQGCVGCGSAMLKGIEDPIEIYWLKTKYSVEDLDSTLAARD